MNETIPKEIKRRELADFLQLTPRRIDQLIEEGILKSSDGTLNFSESIRALLSHQRERATPSSERVNTAKAKILERQDRQESGEDISATVVIRTWEAVLVVVKQRFLRVGNNVQSKIGLTEPQRAAVDEEVRGALGEFGKRLVYTAQVADDDGEEKAIEALKL